MGLNTLDKTPYIHLRTRTVFLSLNTEKVSTVMEVTIIVTGRTHI